MGRGRLFRRVGLWFAGTVAAVVIILAAAAVYVLSPSGTTFVANRYGPMFFDGDLSIGRLELKLGNYPYVGIKITDGVVYTPPAGHLMAVSDTLVAFGELSLSLDIARAYRGDIFIRGLSLDRPDARLSVDTAGSANWEMLLADGSSSGTGAEYTFGFDGLTVSNGRLSYVSEADSMNLSVSLEKLALEQLSDTSYTIDLASRATVAMGGMTVADNTALSARGGFALGRDFMTYGFDRLEIDLNDIPVTLDGSLSLAADSVDADMAVRVHPVAVKALLAQVPENAMPEISKLSTDIAVEMDAEVRGTYRFDGGRLPAVALDIRSSGGRLAYEDVGIPVDHLDFDASLYFNPEKPDSTGAVIRHMNVRSAGVTAAGYGQVWDALNDPRMDVCVKGNFDFTNIADLLPLPEGMVLRGEVDFDVDLRGRLSRLDHRNPGNTYINAAVWMNRFLVASRTDSVLVYADKSEFTVGLDANRRVQDTLMDASTQVLYLAANADTLSVMFKNQYYVRASGVDIDARNDARSLRREPGVVHPLYGSGQIAALEFRGPDSMRIEAEDAFTRFEVMPKAEDPSVPVLSLGVGAYSFSMFGGGHFARLNGTDISLTAELIEQDAGFEARREQVLDSLQLLFPKIERDSLFGHMRHMRRFVIINEDFAEYDVDMTAPEDIGAIMRRWNARGSIYAINGRVVTPFFPLDNSISNIDVTFTTDEVAMNRTKFRAGGSDMTVTGRIYNLRRVLAGRGNLMADMDIRSDSLDFNELIRTINYSYELMKGGGEVQAELAGVDNEQELKDVITASGGVAEASELLVIPSNIEMNFNFRVGNGRYAGLVFESMTGNMVARERCLQINGFDAVTDAGEFTFNALYATRSKEDITTGFDLEIRDIEIEKFISAVPSIDSLFPMMRSFEGLLDCQVAATAQLDTSMNIILPTLNAACRLNGSDLVLLDGETFAEIAKKLKFKNRERNYIDAISVEMLVRDNKVEMFPFVLEMDRYRTAVSGIHNLDMTFDYHISVLRSPVPFRFGLNIRGSLEKLKFGIGRAKYKNENVPSYVEMVDSARLNLRAAITDIFNKGVQAAVLSDMRITPDVELTEELLGDSTDVTLTAADSLLMLDAGMLGDTVTLTRRRQRELRREMMRSRENAVFEKLEGAELEELEGILPEALDGTEFERLDGTGLEGLEGVEFKDLDGTLPEESEIMYTASGTGIETGPGTGAATTTATDGFGRAALIEERRQRRSAREEAY